MALIYLKGHSFLLIAYENNRQLIRLDQDGQLRMWVIHSNDVLVSPVNITKLKGYKDEFSKMVTPFQEIVV